MLSFLAEATPAVPDAIPAVPDVAPSAPDVMEIVKNIHEFYNQAWDDLFALVTLGAVILVGVFGILMPWWSERRRKESFDAMQKELDRAKDKMAAVEKQIDERDKEQETRLEETTQEIHSARDDALKRVTEHEAATKIRLCELEGGVHCNTALTAEEQEKHAAALTLWCLGAFAYLKAANEGRARTSLGGAASVSEKVSAQSLDKDHRALLKDVLDKAETTDLKDSASESIAILRAFLASASEPERDNGDAPE